MEVSLKAGCLPYAVRKRPTIPLINTWKKMDVKMMMMMMRQNLNQMQL